MGDDGLLTNLIAAIYDAALDDARWPEILARIADFVDGRATGLLAKDSTRQQVEAHWHTGSDPYYLRLYAETYSKLGPVATTPARDVEQIVSVPELMPYDDFLGGRFYQEWARPQGWVDVAIAVLDKSGGSSAYLSISRDETSGMVDETMRWRMGLLVPHVRRSVLIGKTIGFKQADAATFTEVLDGLSAGVVLVDAGCRIVYVNLAGDEMIRSGDFLRSIGGRLVASDAQVDQRLRATAAASASGDVEIGSKGVAVPLSAHDGQRYVAHVLPLSSGERQRTAAASSAVAALFVRRAALEFPSAPDVIGQTYELTPTELRVLLAIVEIGGVPEIAAAFGVAESTVKTHLGRLFEKTGTSRQADLVKLVAGFSTPLAD